MKLLDLFAGIGGFSLAAHWMGWETVAFVERDKFCQRVLRKNFGEDIEIHDDICTFSGKPFRGRVDIVTGGFPCLPFSNAGYRKGFNDERYLFPETLRVVREVQPAWVVLENVNGLLNVANEVRNVKLASRFNSFNADIHDYEAIYARTEIMLLNCIREEIERAGYAVQPLVIPASAIGAPHERKRIWIVAHANGGEQERNTRTNGQKKRDIRRHHTGDVSTGPIEYVADANGAGLQGYECGNDPEEFHRLFDRAWGNEGPDWTADWVEVAAELCRMDARVSNRVDRLKSLGNSIVPQIAFEIFRAIEQTHGTYHPHLTQRED